MPVIDIILWDYSAKLLAEMFMGCIGRTPTGNELSKMTGAINYGVECDDFDNYFLGIAQNVAESASDF